MSLAVFRSQCADANVTDRELLGYIMDLKRSGVQFTDAEKNEICTMLKSHRRGDLAKKLHRNLSRYRKQR